MSFLPPCPANNKRCRSSQRLFVGLHCLLVPGRKKRQRAPTGATDSMQCTHVVNHPLACPLMLTCRCLCASTATRVQQTVSLNSMPETLTGTYMLRATQLPRDGSGQSITTPDGRRFYLRDKYVTTTHTSYTHMHHMQHTDIATYMLRTHAPRHYSTTHLFCCVVHNQATLECAS